MNIFDSQPTIILYGLPGSGKSTVGSKLANVLGVGFHDIDSAVPQNIRSIMAAGEVVPKEMMDSFFNSYIDELSQQCRGKASVISVIISNVSWINVIKKKLSNPIFFRLDAPLAVLKERATMRKNHFFNPQFLDQFFGSELDITVPGSTHIDATQTIDEIVQSVCKHIDYEPEGF